MGKILILGAHPKRIMHKYMSTVTHTLMTRIRYGGSLVSSNLLTNDSLYVLYSCGRVSHVIVM